MLMFKKFPVFHIEIQGIVKYEIDARFSWHQFYQKLRREVKTFSLLFSPSGIYAIDPTGKPIGHLILVAYGFEKLAIVDGQLKALATFKKEWPETYDYLCKKVVIREILDVNEFFRSH